MLYKPLKNAGIRLQVYNVSHPPIQQGTHLGLVKHQVQEDNHPLVLDILVSDTLAVLAARKSYALSAELVVEVVHRLPALYTESRAVFSFR